MAWRKNAMRLLNLPDFLGLGPRVRWDELCVNNDSSELCNYKIGLDNLTTKIEAELSQTFMVHGSLILLAFAFGSKLPVVCWDMGCLGRV